MFINAELRFSNLNVNPFSCNRFGITFLLLSTSSGSVPINFAPKFKSHLGWFKPKGIFIAFLNDFIKVLLSVGLGTERLKVPVAFSESIKKCIALAKSSSCIQLTF